MASAKSFGILVEATGEGGTLRIAKIAGIVRTGRPEPLNPAPIDRQMRQIHANLG
jgi:hypothetical protein